jgi:hypothetical protein
MRKTAVLSLLLLSSSSLLLATVTAQKPRSGDLPVTVTIEGNGADTAPTLRIQSDGQGVYKHSNSLQSIIQGIGDWELDMLNFTSSPQRTILVDLRDPVPNSAPNGTTPTAPFGYEKVRGRFIAKCSLYGGNMQTMYGGLSISCPLAVAFDQGGRRYRLAFNPENFPNEVDPVNVTCMNPVGTAKCSQWRIEPSVVQTDGTMKNRAKLIRVASSRKETDQDLGEFYMSFAINVTNP